MSSTQLAFEIEDPYIKEDHPLDKSFVDLFTLLNVPTKRQARVNHESETINKAINTIISSQLLDSGFDAGNQLLNVFENIIYIICTLVRQSEQMDMMLNVLVDAFSPDRRDSALMVHRTTVESTLPDLTRKECDQYLEKNYKENMETLSEVKGMSKYATLTIDSTGQTIHTIFPNGYFRYIHVGQKSTWEKGFEYSACYDATHQQFLGVIHHDAFMKESEKRDIRTWLRDLKAKTKCIKDAGSEVKLIEGDRGYFSAEPFAAATLGFLSPDGNPKHSPRFIAPRKFTKEKDSFKWDYLLDENREQVFIDYLQLNPYTHPGFREQCKGNFEFTDKYRFMIPYACVALVDEYNIKRNRDLADVRATAKRIEEKIVDLTIELEKAEDEYITYLLQLGKEKVSKPGYGKGRRRKNFKDDIDKFNYLRCFEVKERLNKAKKKKSDLLKSVMFMAISLRPGEDPTKYPRMFINLAKDYHERWGIERGFEDTKGKFLWDCRSRKPTKRLRQLMIGMMFYNNWHIERMKKMLIMYRNSVWNKVPWNPDRPWIRRRIEKKFGACLSADAYLLQLLEMGIKYQIKKILSDFN